MVQCLVLLTCSGLEHSSVQNYKTASYRPVLINALGRDVLVVAQANKAQEQTKIYKDLYGT